MNHPALLLHLRGATAIGRRALVVLLAAVALVAILPAVALADTAHPCEDDPFDCVPAWRWVSNSDRFYTDFASNPIEGAMSAAGTFIPSLFFTIAKLLWQVLFWAVKLAMTHDYLSETSHQVIDENFARVADWATQGFAPLLFIIAIAWVVISVGRKAAGGGGQLSWASMVRPATCFALLFWMLAAAGGAPSTGGIGAGTSNVRQDSNVASSRTGAPSWFISKSQEISGVVGELSASTMSSFASPPDDASTLNGNRSRLGCYSVAERLMRTGRVGLTGDDRQVHNIAMLISTIWQRTYQEQYTVAQFGDTDSGRRMSCYMLEHQNMRPSAEMRWISNANGVSAEAPAFSSWGTDDNKERELTALAACHWASGGAVTQYPAWEHGFDAVAARRAQEEGGLGDEAMGAVDRIREWMKNLGDPDVEAYCANVISDNSRWWEGWGSAIDFDLRPRDILLSGFGMVPSGALSIEFYDNRIRANGDPFLLRREANIISGTTPATTDDAGLRYAAEVREFLMALNGHNIKNSAGSGLMSAVVALIYGWAIGGLAFGALIAQFGALAFAVAFPFVLLMGMWPTEAAKGRFYKLCRIGIGMMFARLVMTTLLTLLVIFTVIFIEVMQVVNVGFTALSAVHGSSGFVAQAGFASGMVQAVPPIAGVLTMKWLAKQAGFANPASFKGATGMVSDITSGANNMGTHAGGRGMSMLKQRMHPMSPYGPLSMRRNMRRLQNGLSSKPKGGKKDASDPKNSKDPKGGKDGADSKKPTKDDKRKRDAAAGMPPSTASDDDKSPARTKKDPSKKDAGDQSARSERKTVGADGRARKAIDTEADAAATNVPVPVGDGKPEPPAWFKRAAEARRKSLDTSKDAASNWLETMRNSPAARAGQRAAELTRTNWYANQGARAIGAAGRGAAGAAKWTWGSGREKHELNGLQRNVRRAAIGAGGVALFGGAAAALPLGGVMPAAAAVGSHLPFVGGAFSAVGANMVAPAVMGGAGFGGFQAVALAYGGVQASKLARGGRGAVGAAVEHYGGTQQPTTPFDPTEERPLVAHATGAGQIPPPPPGAAPTPPPLPPAPSGGSPAPTAAGLVPPRGAAAVPSPAPTLTAAPAPIPMPVGQPAVTSGWQQQPSGLHVPMGAAAPAVAAPMPMPIQPVAPTATFTPPSPPVVAAAAPQVIHQTVQSGGGAATLAAGVAPMIGAAVAAGLAGLPAQMAAMGTMAASSRVGGGTASDPQLLRHMERLAHELRTSTDTQRQLRGSLDTHRTSLDTNVSTTQAAADRMQRDLGQLGQRIDTNGQQTVRASAELGRSAQQVNAASTQASAASSQAALASQAAAQQQTAAAHQVAGALGSHASASQAAAQQQTAAARQVAGAAGTHASASQAAAQQQATAAQQVAGAATRTSAASEAAARQAATTARSAPVDRSNRGTPRPPT